MSHPRLTVIVPAWNCAPYLRRSLAALASSDLPRHEWELVVADDGSTDETSAVARDAADRVVRVSGGPSGPAAARNAGAAGAKGDVLVFIDADVCVATSTLRQFVEVFSARPDVGAVFGAYDLSPESPGIVSQYRNLLHHYVHSSNPGPATTFWAGCGAVRREVFSAFGGYDAGRYPRPQIEDIEFGYRLAAAGVPMLLRPEIQGKHLKRWTLRGGFVTDFRDRGVPWMELLLERKELAAAGPLNLRRREKFFTLLVPFACLTALAAVFLRSPGLGATAVAALLVVIAGNSALFHWFARVRGVPFALGIVPLRLAYYGLNAVSAGWALLQHRVGSQRRKSSGRARLHDTSPSSLN